ncbi:unnamed protein product [Rotaria sp. Silwood1]|nr:unnamed protein product [Rotaria sp. Silwood1]
MNKLCIRSYIKTRWLLGLTAAQIHDELTAAYGQGVVSYSTAAHWMDRFPSGRESGAWPLCDIVLGDESWFYHRKIKSKQESKAWVAKEESASTEVRRQVPSETSINAMYYRDECLKDLVKMLHKKRPLSTTNHIKLHHDNAQPHMNDIVVNYLQEEKINVMAHPPYSLDLAPSDFWLFNCLKRTLDTYPNTTSLANTLSKELNSLPIQEYQKTFQKWTERMKLCIEHRGDYFEHLL